MHYSILIKVSSWLIGTVKGLVFIATLFLVSVSALLAQRDCIFTAARSLARYRTLDTARYLVRYRYLSKASAQQKVADEDVVTLQIGDRYTKSYSENLYQTDSVATVMLNQGARVLPTYSDYAQREDLYTCLVDQSVTTVYRTFLMVQSCAIRNPYRRLSGDFLVKRRPS